MGKMAKTLLDSVPSCFMLQKPRVAPAALWVNLVPRVSLLSVPWSERVTGREEERP